MNTAPAPVTTGTALGLVPQNLGEAMKLAEVMARATIVPKDFQGNPGNILVAIQWGAEIGLAPLQAMQSVAVINGRPAIWGDAALALVRGSGILESITEEVTDAAATCRIKRRGEAETARTFTLEDAKRAGLTGKAGPWTQYPKRMLQMRARAWALRDVFPDVLRGVHVAEEAKDMPAPRDMGEAERVAEEPPASRAEQIKGRLRSQRAAPEPEPEPTDTAPPPDLPPGATRPTTDRPISAAQHRRLEALLKEHGIPRERVKAWLHRRQPALYGSPADVHLDQITPATADQIIDEIPRFVAILAREAERKREQADILAEALDAAVEAHAWHSDLGDLPRVIEEMQGQARAAYQSAHARDRDGPDPADLAQSERLSHQARALADYLASNQPKEQAA